MKIVKTGRIQHSTNVAFPVRIVEVDFIPGTGDYQDEGSIREDKLVSGFELQIASDPDGRYNASRGVFEKIEEVLIDVAKNNWKIDWD